MIFLIFYQNSFISAWEAKSPANTPPKIIHHGLKGIHHGLKGIHHGLKGIHHGLEVPPEPRF